ncbi:hypothetical protein [Vulcanisaeta souniana]|uniref:hypothetical protein n=1 Tax=Vulcanisaeta souniana TaxID=164452 RepID=UPI000A865FE9|nr:hypothetical protein [Vulcanisaeta souniana]
MTAGCWAYIGTQGILQGTYETIGGAAADRHFSGSLEGSWWLAPALVTWAERSHWPSRCWAA